MLKGADGKPSLTRTLYAGGFVIACAKLLFSGMSVGSFTMSEFTGVDFGAVVASLGGVYHLGKTVIKEEK